MFEGKLIDLSQEIYQGMPVYPGHLKTVVWTHMSHEECQRQLGTGFSYETRGIMFCDHGPTHIDALSHLSRDPEAESERFTFVALPLRIRKGTGSPLRAVAILDEG